MTKGIIDEWAEDCGLDDWADVVDDCGIGEGSLKNLKQRIAKAIDDFEFPVLMSYGKLPTKKQLGIVHQSRKGLKKKLLGEEA